MCLGLWTVRNCAQRAKKILMLVRQYDESLGVYKKTHTTHTRTYTHIQCRDVCMWSISRCSFPPGVLCVCVCVLGCQLYQLTNTPSSSHPSIHTCTHTYLWPRYSCVEHSARHQLKPWGTVLKNIAQTHFFVHVHLEITQFYVHTHI